MPTEMELTLEQTQQGVSYEVSVLSDIEDSHGPSDAMHNPLPATQSQKDFVSKLTEIHSFLLTSSLRCQSVKVKEFQERCNIKAFQEWYEHVGPEVASPQGGKVSRWQRDCAWLMISRCSRSLCQIQVQGTSSIQEVNDHYNIFTRESQEYELKTKDKA
ncbi:hypothetical protein Tco_0320044 [Tanacetum coccineum]